MTEAELSILDLFYRLERQPNSQVARLRELIYQLRIVSTSEKNRLVTELNRELQSYKWVRHVRRTPDGYRTVLLPAMGNASSEQGAVCTLVNLIDNPRELSRLRRCEWCGAWLYGGRKFCDNGGVCKQRAWDSKPENRKSKNEYMRDYYERNYSSSRRRAKKRKSAL